MAFIRTKTIDNCNIIINCQHILDIIEIKENGYAFSRITTLKTYHDVILTIDELYNRYSGFLNILI